MQRRLASHAHRNVSSSDLNLRIAFKVLLPLPFAEVAAARPCACCALPHAAPLALTAPLLPHLLPHAQLGALAEFRGDWAGALRMYGEAYAYVPQVCTAGALKQRSTGLEILLRSRQRLGTRKAPV